MTWIVIIVVLYWLISYVKAYCEYKKSTYCKETQKGFFRVITNKGLFGEYQTYIKLRGYEKRGAKFLFNCYMPTKDGKTSEIDLIMIYQSRVFVFESKNYSGWIFGDEKSRNWTQTLNAGNEVRKNHFYNPIKQNETHIKWLSDVLGEKIGPMISVFSVIVFSERCELKNVKYSSFNLKVVNRYDVVQAVEELGRHNTIPIFPDKGMDIYNVLKPYTNASEEVKQKHIENVRRTTGYKTFVQQLDPHVVKTPEPPLLNVVGQDKICKRCGAKMVLRTVKRGENKGNMFYGCSNFPKCRYTTTR